MNDQTETLIRQRAYEIWQEEGEPSGRDHYHWEKARAEILSLPKTKQTPKSRASAASKKGDKTSPKAKSTARKSTAAPRSKTPSKSKD